MFKDYTNTQKIFILAVSLILLGLSWKYGKNIPLKDQWPLFEALRNTSAIIFAVIGAWFAIVYPERLQFKKSEKKENNKNKENNFDRFFHPLISSSIVLIIILLLSITLPIFKSINFLIDHKEIGRSIIYLLLTALTLWQVLSVLAIIQLADIIKSIADEFDGKEKMKEILNSSGKTVTEEEANKIEAKDP